MNYEKLTPEKFTEKLKGSVYDSLTGARRAIGKASWPETAKATARTQAEKFFGTGGLAKLKAKPAKAPKAAKAPKKAAAPVAEAKTVVSPKKIFKKTKQTGTSDASPMSFAVAGKQLTLADVRKNPFQVIQLAEHCVASGTSVLNALTEMRKQNPNLDVTEPTATAVKTIQNGLNLASRVILSLIDEVVSNGSGHAPEETMPGEPVYTAPGTDA
jgi:hypothetical protein